MLCLDAILNKELGNPRVGAEAFSNLHYFVSLLILFLPQKFLELPLRRVGV